MVGSLIRFLFMICEELQTHSFVCDSSQQVNKNHTYSPAMNKSLCPPPCSTGYSHQRKKPRQPQNNKIKSNEKVILNSRLQSFEQLTDWWL